MTRDLAQQARDVIAAAGGRMTQAEYDAEMRRLYWPAAFGGEGRRTRFAPLSWAPYLGLRCRRDRESNFDKLMVFEACRLGLVEPTDDDTGYKLAEVQAAA